MSGYDEWKTDADGDAPARPERDPDAVRDEQQERSMERQRLNAEHRANMADPAYAARYEAAIVAKVLRQGPSVGRQPRRVDFDTPLYPSKK